ncbi:C40 family peptidase [Streptomyces tubercidicus]|uniref:C40 family peptidase n=1 Tax=Streptomyces tubercidicus TaxID=47759 RepID=UPI0036BC2A3A
MDTYSQWAGIANASPYSDDGTNGGSVNAIRKAVFGSEGRNLTGWAQDVQDAQAAAFLVSRNSGFSELAPGSRNINSAFTGYLGNVKDLSLLNPTMKASDVAGMMGSMTSTRGLYAAQMFGYKPLLGQQGKVERGALGGFADSVMQRTFQGKSSIAPAELKASLGQNGSLHANIQAYVNSVGGDSSMATALEDYITGRNTAASKGLSGSEFDKLMSDYEAGGSKGDAAGKRLKKFGVTNTILQSQKDVDAAKSGNISDLVDSLGPAVKRANAALKDFYNFLDDIVNMPGVKQTLGTALGWGSVLGPAMGSAFGAMAGMRMGGGVLGVGGSLLGLRPVSGAGGMGGALGRLGRGAGYGAAAAGVGMVGGGLADQIEDPGLRAGANTLVDAGSGALVGAGIGSIIPGVGTAVGGAVGGVIGAGVGLWKTIRNSGSERTTRTDGVNGGAAGSKDKGGAVPSGEPLAGKQASGAIRAALSEVGKPYEWGATGPNSFDCSGLMQHAYKRIGVRLPRVSQQQMKVGQPVKRKEARPGDLMFPNPGHVVMYLGGNRIVEAPRPGKNVRVVSADSYGSYQAIRRIVGAVGSFDGAEDQDANTQKEQTGNLGGDSGSMVFSGDYGSTEEVDAISSAMAGAGSALLNSPMGHSASKPEADEGSDVSVEKAPGSVKGNVALGKKMAAAKGWVGRQWDALYRLWMGESGWNEHADNPSSDAYGIPQAMTNLHKETNTSSWKNSPRKQISWGLDYIDRAYGDPVNAYGKWKSRKPHWYNTGAWEIPEDQPAVVHKGEMVIEKPKADAIRSVLMRDIVPVRDAATGTSSRSASDGAVSLVFNNGSIVVQVNGAVTDSSAREAAKSFVDQLTQDKRLRTLARGQ